MLHNFDGTHGQDPSTTPMEHTSGLIYGTTETGGADDGGVFWELNSGISPFVSIVGISSGAPNTLVEVLGWGDHRDYEQGHVYEQAEVQGDALTEVEIFFW